MKQAFKNIIVDSQEKEFKSICTRDIEVPVNTNKIVTLIGVRRSGKTYVLYDVIKKLRKTVNRENIIYINFEDDRLSPLFLSDLDLLVQAYYELYPDKRTEKVYFFLDEVQVVEGWETFIRRLDDTLDVQLFITGSSSKLLSSEIATSLRGRTITYEIFPFSFSEYLGFKEVRVNFNSSKSVSYVKNEFEIYLKQGGFVETFEQTDDVQRRILKDYMDLIVYKDLVERYAIKNQTFLKHLVKYLFVNMATLVSYNKLYNNYKSMGYKLGKDTLFDYMAYLQEAYTMFAIPIFRNSVREEQRNPRKLYGIDNGFKNLFGSIISGDYSKLYENMAFLHLRRKYAEIYYYKQKQEVDFYVPVASLLVNVSYKIDSEETRKREYSGLLEAMNYLDIPKAYLITEEEEATVNLEGKVIEIVPLWKWVLS